VLDSTVLREVWAALEGDAGGGRLGRRPFVTLSYAQSLDGSIAARPGRSLRLSGAPALRLTHALRACHDAILVGIGTVLADDPRLTVRLVAGEHPQPVVVDSRLRFPLTANLLRPGQAPPWIAAGPHADPRRRDALVAAGANVIDAATTGAGWIDLPALLGRLGELGVRRLMVEGGARVIESFVADRLVDQLVVTVAPRLVGGPRALGGAGGPVAACLPRLVNVHYERLGDDFIVRGDPVWGDE
jgi:GTP cyclohydrolase II